MTGMTITETPNPAGRRSRKCCRWVVASALLMLTACAPSDPGQVLADAEAAFAAGDSRTAIILTQNLLQEDPANIGARALLGRIALAAGDADFARNQLEIARDAGASTAVVLVPLASALIQLNQAGLALQTLDSLPEDLRNADYWVARGRALAVGGDYRGAEEALDIAGEMGGETSTVLVERARVAMARGDAEGGVDLLERALALDPENADALTIRGMLAFTEQRLEPAEADLTAAANLYLARSQGARAGPVLLRLVQVQLVLNELEDASETARRLSATMPNTAFADYASALVSFQRGDYEQTIQRLRLALTKSPGQALFQSLLGAAHLAAGNYGQAEQQFMSVLSANPSDPAALRLLAETRIRQQRPEAALAALSGISVSDIESDVGLLLLQGTAYLQSGNAEDAIPYLEQAVAINSADQNAVLQLARAYSETGRSTEAFDLLRSTPALTLDEAYTANVLVLLTRLQREGAASAKAYVDRLIEERPADASAQMLMAIYHQMANEPSAAKANLATALELDPEFVPAHLSLAALLVEEGRIQDAESELHAVIQIDTGNLAALLSLAQLAAQQGDLDEARSHLEQAAANGTSATPVLALARLDVARGDSEAAQAQVARAEQMGADETELLITRGIIALGEGESGEAESILARAWQQMPNRPSVALLLSRVQLANGNAEAARATLTDAVATMPSVPELRIGLGAAELGAGNEAEALAIARDLQVDFGRRAAGFALEGQLRMRARRYDEAASMFGLAYERESTWAMLVNLVNASRLSTGSADQAVDLLRDWLAESPGDVRARLLVGDLLSDSGELEGAMDEYLEALEVDPENITALNNAAWFSLELGRPEALDYAQHAADFAPENPAVLDTLGWILVQQNRAGDSLEYLRRATQLAPQAVEIRYHLGVAQARLGQTESARATLQAVLDADDGAFAERDDALRLLEAL